MDTSVQEKPSRECRKRIREADRVVQDARETMGSPSNLHRKRRSPERYISYMSLMTKLVETTIIF